jgi:hypothetical protein
MDFAYAFAVLLAMWKSMLSRAGMGDYCIELPLLCLRRGGNDQL